MPVNPASGYREVNMTGEQLEFDNQNFTNQLRNGNLSGYKLDPSDNGLPDWEITVYYENGTVFGTDTTDSNGYFRFDPVPFGNYTVYETLKNGYTQLAPPGGFWTVNMTDETLVNTTLNFTNMEIPKFGNFSGYKLDPADNGLPDWEITVYYENGTLFDTNITDSGGASCIYPFFRVSQTV